MAEEGGEEKVDVEETLESPKGGGGGGVFNVEKLFDGETLGRGSRGMSRKESAKAMKKRPKSMRSLPVSKESAQARGVSEWWHEVYFALILLYCFIVNISRLGQGANDNAYIGGICMSIVGLVLLLVWIGMKISFYERRVYGLFGVVGISLDAGLMLYLSQAITPQPLCRAIDVVDILTLVLLLLDPCVAFLHSFINESRTDRGTSLGLQSYMHFLISGWIVFPIVLLSTALTEVESELQVLVSLPLIFGAAIGLVVIAQIFANNTKTRKGDKDFREQMKEEDDFLDDGLLLTENRRKHQSKTINYTLSRKAEKHQVDNGAPACFVVVSALVPIIWPFILRYAGIPYTEELIVVCEIDIVVLIWALFTIIPVALVLFWDWRSYKDIIADIPAYCRKEPSPQAKARSYASGLTSKPSMLSFE